MDDFLQWLLWGNNPNKPYAPGQGGPSYPPQPQQPMTPPPMPQQPQQPGTPSIGGPGWRPGGFPPGPPPPPPPQPGGGGGGWWPFGNSPYQGPKGNLGIKAKRPSKENTGWFGGSPTKANIPQREFEPVEGQPGAYEKTPPPERGAILLGKDGKYYMYKGGPPDKSKSWIIPDKDQVTEYHRQETQKRQGRLEERHEKEYKERKEERREDKKEKRSEWEIARDDRIEYRRQAEETRKENKAWREQQAGERKEERGERAKERKEDRSERAQAQRMKAMQSAFHGLGKGLPHASVPGASVHVPQAGNVFQSLTQALSAASKQRRQ